MVAIVSDNESMQDKIVTVKRPKFGESKSSLPWLKTCGTIVGNIKSVEEGGVNASADHNQNNTSVLNVLQSLHDSKENTNDKIEQTIEKTQQIKQTIQVEIMKAPPINKKEVTVATETKRGSPTLAPMSSVENPIIEQNMGEQLNVTSGPSDVKNKEFIFRTSVETHKASSMLPEDSVSQPHYVSRSSSVNDSGDCPIVLCGTSVLLVSLFGS